MFLNPKKFILRCMMCSFSFMPVLAMGGAWDRVTQSSHTPPEVIGSPAAGCVGGAVSLPTVGTGYQVMRLSRNRIYGHPLLIGYIRDLGAALAAHHLGVMLVGDLGQPRGGPTASLHRSHQNGLDVDLWYWLPEVAAERRLTTQEIEHLAAPSVLTQNRRALNPAHWTATQVKLLRLAAAPEEVDRIFVHPVIKKSLCNQAVDRDWLHKIRPWWNHDDHLHVRLSCPPFDSRCVAQKPIPSGDGCGADLDWWLAAVAAPAPKHRLPPPPAPVLPVACDAVLRAP